jgi:hypothetical protein
VYNQTPETFRTEIYYLFCSFLPESFCFPGCPDNPEEKSGFSPPQKSAILPISSHLKSILNERHIESRSTRMASGTKKFPYFRGEIKRRGKGEGFNKHLF